MPSSASSPRRYATPSLLLFVAWQDLRSSGWTALVLIGAVAAGVGFQVPNTANIVGYESEMLDRGVRTGFGDVRVYPRHGGRIGPGMLDRVRAVPGVHGAAAALILPAVIGRGDQLDSVAALGIEAPDGRHPFRVVEGATLSPGDDRGILLGRGLAGRLGVRAGDQVTLRIVLGRDRLDEDIGRYHLTVRGLFAGAFAVCATDSVVLDRSFLARELGDHGATDLLLVYSDDPDGAGALATRIASSFPDLDARSWADDSALLRNAIHGSAAVAALSSAMVVLAVALPVAALLYVRSVHRRRHVALLAAVGIGRWEIFAAFLIQTVAIGLCGVLIGCPLAFAVIAWFRAHPIFAMEEFTLKPVESAGIFVRPALTVLAATVLAGVYPAWRAAHADPGAILRRET